METKFYLCKHCGNLFSVINDGGVTPLCCGEKMIEIKANSTEAALEKHIPVVSVEGNKVNVVVGDVIHPMIETHWIDWIYVETNLGHHIVKLNPGQEPKATFTLADNEKASKVYAHCNLHGLWVKEL